MANTKVLLCVAVFLVINVASMDITLSSVKKAVRGSNVTFTATVLGYKAGDVLSLQFHDNATPQHTKEITPSSNVTMWTVEYPKSLYESRDYTVKVDLWRRNVIWYRVETAVTIFQLTDSLNGNLTLNQSNVELPNSFVAVNKTVKHYIKLPENELKFLEANSSSIDTYWFKDCVPYGPTKDFSFNFKYNDTMNDHHVTAFIIANNQPEPPITTTTAIPTTTKPTTTPKPITTSTEKPLTTTTENQTTTPETTTTSKPSTTALPVTEKINVTEVLPLEQAKNKTRRKRSIPNDICDFSPYLPIGVNDTYGRYTTKLSVREPLTTVNITGLNWLQHGDLLNLEVKYTGSPPFSYCIFYKMGQYNVTGNETCLETSQTMGNSFPLVHYFSDSDQHTVVVVIENDIGKTVKRAVINIYKTPINTQLSVIVIPVFFCLVAVILVVFGIAYYQHRSRHTVEVADFDFGQAHPDFKTFRERLRDSFRNAFNFGNRDDTDPLTANNRYDSMST